MCFAPQRRALFRHLNCQKWSGAGMFCTFWLQNVLRATTAALFRHRNFQKWSEPGVFCYILTSKCASRHNGVHFFNIRTSKSGANMWWFVHFDLEMCFAPQRRALFRHLNCQKWSGAGMFCTFWLQNVLRATTACTFSTSQLPKVVRSWCVLYILTSKCASRHNGVQFFISHLASWLRTRRLSKPTFRPSGATNHWKNTVNRNFPTFSRICIFFLLTLSLLLFSLLIFLFSLPLPCSAFHLCILSEVWLLNFLRSWKLRRLVLGICCCNTSENVRLSWKRPSKIRLCSSNAARQSWRNVSSRRKSRESANGSPKCKAGVNSDERAFFGGCNVQFHCKHVLNKYLFRSSERFHLITHCRVKHLPETYSLPQYRGRPSLTKLSCRKNRWYGWENGNKLPRNWQANPASIQEQLYDHRTIKYWQPSPPKKERKQMILIQAWMPSAFAGRAVSYSGEIAGSEK